MVTIFDTSSVYTNIDIDRLCMYTSKKYMARIGKISRKTKETSISVEVNIDGKGKYQIDTGIGFLDHMLEQLSKHSLIDLKVKAKGDTHIDLHHTTEDTGIAIGETLKKAAKKFVGIKRYAHRVIPMDETLTRVAIDVSNRPYIVKGERMPQPGIPESFNVLLHELKGLGLKVTLD